MVSDQWTKTTLGNSAHIIMGASPPGTSYNEDGQGLPLLNGPAEFGLTHPTPVQWTSEPTQICKPGDVLLCVRGSTTGRQNIADQVYCIGRGLAAIRANEKSHGAFIKFSLEQIASAILQRARGSGSTFPNINSQELRNWSVLLPPLPEQKKIAAILSSVDEAIAFTQAVIDQTRKVKQGLLQQLLTRGIGHTRFKESAIGEIPEVWEVVAFESLAQIGPQNGIYKSKDDYGSGTPMIDMGDIFKLDIIDEAERRCVRLTAEEQEKFTLQYGDLLFARRSLVAEGSGKCSMVGHHSIPPVFESSIIRFRLKANICNSLFYFYYWESPIGKKLRRRITRQVAVSGVTGKDLEKLPIALPPLDEQVEITSILKSLDEDIASHEPAITRLNFIKRGLMQDLLTGKVRVGCIP